MESPWMPLNPKVIAEYPDGMAINTKHLHITRGCESVLQTYVVGGDGHRFAPTFTVPGRIRVRRTRNSTTD